MPKIPALLATFFGAYSIWNFKEMGLGEILAASIFVATYLIGRFVFKRDLSGMLIAGLIPGMTLEWITEAYWKYHLNVYVWGDVSLYVVLGWGYNFTFLALMSGYAFKRLKGIGALAGEQGQLICDGVIGTVFFIANEFIGTRLLGLWEYTPISNWRLMIPGLNYPLEGVFGALLIATVFPSFLRRWEKSFRISADKAPEPA